MTGLVLALGGAIGYTNVYVPFYSKAARERRAQVQNGTLPEQPHSPLQGGGSTWENVSTAARVRACMCARALHGNSVNRSQMFRCAASIRARMRWVARFIAPCPCD